MKYDPDKHHRRSIRLRGYDYARAGAYFITLCAENHDCLFGEIVNGRMLLNELGMIVWDEWLKTPGIRREISLDAFVAMPDHIHGVVWINDDNPGNSRGIRPDAPTATHITPPIHVKHGPDNRSLGSFIAGFKSVTAKRINQIRNMPGIPVWQRNYGDRIIRNNDALSRIRQYIVNNPAKWRPNRCH